MIPRRGTWKLKVSQIVSPTIWVFRTENFEADSYTLFVDPASAVNVLDGFTLAKIAGDDVIVNTINPGFCHSELTRDLSGIQGLFVKFVDMRGSNLVMLADQTVSR